jgi:hypothetical protein
MWEAIISNYRTSQVTRKPFVTRECAEYFVDQKRASVKDWRYFRSEIVFNASLIKK